MADTQLSKALKTNYTSGGGLTSWRLSLSWLSREYGPWLSRRALDLVSREMKVRDRVKVYGLCLRLGLVLKFIVQR